MVTDRREPGQALALRIPVGGGDAFQRPVRPAKRADPAGRFVFVQAIHEFSHRHGEVVAVQQIHVHVSGLQPFEALLELVGDAGRRAER